MTRTMRHLFMQVHEVLKRLEDKRNSYAGQPKGQQAILSNCTCIARQEMTEQVSGLRDEGL